ncbi:MAG: DUF885 domain-containing protein [Opitutia bacterium]|nr:DUF885 domain-containing protein [Opitutaceae bacterium]PHX71871.1 MAG: DUF885 domain-containing protein [Opitutae bacterium]
MPAPTLPRSVIFLVTLAAAATSALAQPWRHGEPVPTQRPADSYVPSLPALARTSSSELRELVERYGADRDALQRYYSVTGSALQLARLRAFNTAWQTQLDRLAFDSFDVGGRIDWHLLRLHLQQELALSTRTEERNAELAALLPFADDIARLQEARRTFEPLRGADSAATLAKLAIDIASLRKTLEAEGATKPSKILALRASHRIADLTKTLKDWFDHYNTYDPSFGWWNREPHTAATKALDGYTKFLREKIVGYKGGEDEPIVGDPIGPVGLNLDLQREMIPYSPAQLIAIGEKEFAWCETEWKRAARDMGLGDDWRAALEKTKRDYVEPGSQPALIAEQAYEAIEFVTKRDLLTVPPHAIDTFRMTMMSPERQQVNPFFLGGETIQVSFPTDTMGHDGKLDSLRANNRHFCRATVHHELIPGHHLQMWYAARHNPHRRLFSTPFWIEGWALWWEFHLWDLGFQQSPENRAGMLFWRTHRAARIVFSLNFHLGKWTPQQCIDFLVGRVGHDRHTATGEVRRSFNGDYSPLYQVGYMMGAIQLRALYAELVTSGKMKERDFHDRILQGGPMPIEMVRANVTATKLPRDYISSWKFIGEQP